MDADAPNRLIHEKTPYLRQHAYNPVQWYPWGEEAFEEARRRNKMIFLSIGYSSCHWCHVMERESFADEEIALLLNETCISIKVDREERPDIDAFYMDVCQLLTGKGGWPLTIIMTPDKRPFFAATYLPKESRFGLIGLKELIPRVAEAWRESHAEILSTAEKVRAALEKPVISKTQPIPLDILKRTYTQLADHFDKENGGFGRAPKFPTPHYLSFLLRYAKRTAAENPLVMVEKTLQAMSRGGIYDHLGFGFHRYSTDATWLVPHFEKMLYDQALLAMVYAEAFQLTGKEEYKQTVAEIMTYVSREMTSEEGGFFTAEDADSEGEEGKFYLWTEQEIRKILSPAEAELASKVFNIRPEGNFEEEGVGRAGKNILFLGQPQARLAADFSVPEEALRGRLAAIREKLFLAREKRPKPLKDRKILTDWNGLMIAALAKASQALSEQEYCSAAIKAADFVRARMTRRGQLHHRYAEGEVKIHAFLDDYAFLIWGLIELYETDFEVRFLERALKLTDTLLHEFWDEGEGGFYFTSRESGDLPLRRKEIYDGAVPSGNSVMAANLLRLSRLTGGTNLEERAEKIIAAFSQRIIQDPMAYAELMRSVDFARGPSFEIVIVGRSGAEDTLAMLRSLQQNFIPHKVVLFRPAEMDSPDILKLAPYLEPMTAIDGKATAYVCSNFHCRLPTTDPARMLTLLENS
jgi:uncharacterized protein YyaL (SSP411 family)